MAGKRPNPIVQRIALEGADKIEAELKRLGKTGEATFAAIKKAGGVDLAVGLRQQFATINKDIRSVTLASAEVGRAFASMGRNLSLIGLAIGGAVAGVLAFTKAGTEAVDAAGKQAQALGLMVDEYGRLAHAADQSGVAQEQFASGMSRLNRTIGDAAGGSKTALEAFEQIGVSFKDSAGNIRPVEDIVLDLAQSFSQLPEGALKSSLAMELFGRAGAQMIPFLNSGRDGLRQLGAEAERLGIVFTEAQFRIAETFNDALARVGIAAKGIRSQIAIAFAPAGTALVDSLTEALVRSRATLTDIATEIASRVEPVLFDLLNTLTGNDADVVDKRFLEWRDAVAQFGRDVGSVLTGVVMPTFRAIGAAADAAARGINRVFGTDVSGGAVLLTVALGKITGAFALLNATAKLALASIGFLVKHPVIAALLVLSGRFASLAGQQTIADQAAAEHKATLDDLKAAMAAVGTASSEARDNLRREAEASLAAAEAKRELIKASIDEIALANAIRKVGDSVNADLLIAGILDDERKAVEAYVGEQDKLIAGLRHTARELSKADRETVNLTQSTNDLAAAAGELGAAGQKATSAFPKLAGTATKSVSEALGAVKRETEELGGAAQDSGNETEAATDTMIGAIRRVPDAWSAAATAAQEAATATTAATDSAAASAGTLATSIQSVPAALAEAGTAATTALEPAQAAFAGIQIHAEATAAVLPTYFQTATAAIAELFGQLVQQIVAKLQEIVRTAASVAAATVAQMNRIISAANAAKATVAAAGSGGGGGGGSGFRDGGQVFGPGSSTSDSIPAWLSAGEYVVRARAVDHYGPAIFAALNSLRVPRFEVPRFNAGGIVAGINHSLTGLRMNTGGLVPAMAGGGGGSSVTFVLDNQRVEGFSGTDDAITRLGRLFNRQGLTKTGRGPARLR